MNVDPDEVEILELIKQGAAMKAVADQHWLIAACLKQIALMDADIVRLKRLIDLCKNPEVIAAVDLFVGKK